MSHRTLLSISGLLGISGVALGAFGAHALGGKLAATGQIENWRTAVSYHLIHAIAILAVALYLNLAPAPAKPRLLIVAATCWMTGVVLFSGSLYAFGLGGPHWLWPATPLGGLALIAGWAFILAVGLKRERS